MADLSPTVRQRELGMRLREFRTAKGLTVEDVAKELLCFADVRSAVRRPVRAARHCAMSGICVRSTGSMPRRRPS